MSGIYTSTQVAVAGESWRHWKSKGAGDMLAAALLGNEDRETSFNPKARGDRNKAGIPQAGGPAQQHQDRRAFIKKGCGIDVWTAPHKDQLEGIYWEMSASISPYRHVWPALMATKSIIAANHILVTEYERSASQSSDIGKQNDKASYWFQYFGAKPVIAEATVQSTQDAFGLPKLLWKPTRNFYPSKAKRYLIVVHDCQGGYQGSIATFLSQHHPRVSAHLVLKEDGSEATQMVPWSGDAWHATDFNAGSIGLEMAGFAEKGFAEAEWSAEARMVAYLCRHFDIPVTWSRHGTEPGICRHYDLGRAGGGHTDPCTTDAPWLHFMGLVEAAAAKGGWPVSWGHA